jgi:hypothetical protein
VDDSDDYFEIGEQVEKEAPKKKAKKGKDKTDNTLKIEMAFDGLGVNGCCELAHSVYLLFRVGHTNPLAFRVRPRTRK